MSLTPQDVREQKFRERRKGYDVDEVDAFLERVTQALAQLLHEREQLRNRVDAAEGQEPNELLARTLVTAQRAADETVAAAQVEAERILGDAQAQAAEMLDEARQRLEGERAALDAESTRVARAAESLARFRSEYRTRVKAVIAEQLALLERAGELPDVPPAVADLATFGQAQLEGRLDEATPGETPASALESLSFDDEYGYAHPDETSPADGRTG